MREEKIVITINEDSSLDVKTDGIKGEACISEVETLLEGIAEIKSGKKTDEYYQKVSQQNTIKIQNKG